MYFKDLPTILYDFNIKNKNTIKIVKDITHNVRVRKEILSNIALYDEYDIKDGETPEVIAHKIYGNSEYHWIIMLANDRYDYVDDFPLSTYNLEQHVKQKYGELGMYSVHHYVDENGFIIDSSQAGATSVSNYQYEDDLNETKRRIKIISPELLNTILKNYKDLI